MGFKGNTNDNPRRVFWSQGGNDAEEGKTAETAKFTVAAVIAEAVALVPAFLDNIVITSTGGGNFLNEAITLPNFVSMEATAVNITEANDNTMLTTGDDNCVSLGVLVQASSNPSDGIVISGSNLVDINVRLLSILNNDCSGVLMDGDSANISTMISRISLSGTGSTGIAWKVTGGTGDSVLQSGHILCGGNNTTGFLCDSTSIEIIVANFGSITTNTGTGLIGIDIVDGDASVFVGDINLGASNTAIHVRANGNLRLTGNVVSGNIIVDTGGVLSCDILDHVAGTVTNNGTIIGRIGDLLFNLPSAPGGADTQVQFNNAGVLDGNSNLVFDNNNNLAIGTSSPRQKLHVSTGGTSTYTTATNQGALLTDNVGPRLIFEDTSSGANEKVMLQRWEQRLFSFNTINDVGNSFIDQSIFTINGSTLNIGIGVNVANERLHVNVSGNSGFTSATVRGILITDSVSPRLVLEDTGEGVDQKVMVIQNFGQKIRFSALQDTGGSATLADILEIGRDGVMRMVSSLLQRAANTSAATSSTSALGFRKYYNYVGGVATVNWTINTADMANADVSHVWELTFKDKAGVASVATPFNIIAESGFIDFAGTTQLSITTAGGSISLFCDGTNLYTV